MVPRTLLSAGALLLLVLLAGCSAAGSASLDPVDDAELAERASRSLGPASDPADDAEARMLRTAFENGSATMEARRPPVPEGLPFEHRGAYYDLSWTVVDRRTATGASLEVDYNASDPAGPRIAYGDLPAADRRALSALLPPRADRRVEGYDRGVGVTYNDSEAAASVLVPEQRYDVVVFEGEAYPVRVASTREVEVMTYRYEATRVANGSAAYARALKDEYLFTLRGLSDADREVVEAAVEDDYYADSDDDAAFASVLERFRAHPAVEEDEYSGSWLVRYEGEVYWAQLRYDGFPELSDPGASSGSGQEQTAQG